MSDTGKVTEFPDPLIARVNDDEATIVEAVGMSSVALPVSDITEESFAPDKEIESEPLKAPAVS